MYPYNVLNELGNTGSRNKTRVWGATFDLQWEILPGLEYQGLFSYTSSSSDTKSHATERSFYITSLRGYEYGSIEANSISAIDSFAHGRFVGNGDVQCDHDGGEK